MGTRTANMSVYLPGTGENVYDPAFSAGLRNVDSHDHTGGPRNGKQLDTNSIKDGAITPAKLSSDIYSSVTVQTTDATPTEIVSIPVAAAKVITVQGKAVALRSDATEAAGGQFMGTFHRTTAGSVAIVGAEFVDWNDNSSGSPILTLVADTVGEAISIRATGEAGKTINWRITYNIVSYPTS